MTAAGPPWFRDALAVEPEHGRIEVAGAEIETRAWGERGRPGLLLIHGAGANVDWWRFTAPLLAEDYRVAAFSLSGMGGSDRRPRYSFDLYAEEAFATAKAAGLFEAGEAPVIAAHSFGGRTALRCASGERGAELKAVMTIDSLIRPPDGPSGNRPFSAANTRIYPERDAILARFRLIPAQEVEDPAILDYIAGTSVREVVDPEGRPGWTWRFDPELWDKLEERATIEDLRGARCPVAAIRGRKSALMVPAVTDHFDRNAPPGTPVVVIPEAHHHLMLDQPLAFVAALRGLLAGWPRSRRTA